MEDLNKLDYQKNEILYKEFATVYKTISSLDSKLSGSIKDLSNEVSKIDKSIKALEQAVVINKKSAISNSEQIEQLKTTQAMMLVEIEKLKTIDNGGGTRPPDPIPDKVKAFPSAYGAGSNTVTGGRGGTVIHVTSLADTNTEGTLRWAIGQTYPREIVFDVSGVIELTSDIDISGNGESDIKDDVVGNFTILGQSAPDGGITIDTSNGRFDFFNMHNVIIRYLKFRGDGNVGFIEMTYCDELIVDHCSFSWGDYDKTAIVLGSYTDHRAYIPTDITFQNNFVAHTGRVSTIGNTGNVDSNPETLPFGEVSIHRNVYVNNTWRTPVKFGGVGKIDIANNLIQSSQGYLGKRQMRFDNQAFKLNHISNIYDEGYYTISDSDDLHKVWTSDDNVNAEIYQNDNYYSDGIKPSGYDSNNSLDWQPFNPSSTTVNSIPSKWFIDTPHELNGDALTILESSVLKADLLANIGANRYIKDDATVGVYIDPIDAKYINDVLTDNYIPSERVGNTIPSMPSETRPNDFYVSNPHIPEAYITAKGLTGSSTLHNELAPSGYTWLEEYLNQVDA